MTVESSAAKAHAKTCQHHDCPISKEFGLTSRGDDHEDGMDDRRTRRSACVAQTVSNLVHTSNVVGLPAKRRRFEWYPQ